MIFLWFFHGFPHSVSSRHGRMAFNAIGTTISWSAGDVHLPQMKPDEGIYTVRWNAEGIYTWWNEVFTPWDEMPRVFTLPVKHQGYLHWNPQGYLHHAQKYRQGYLHWIQWGWKPESMVGISNGFQRRKQVVKMKREWIPQESCEARQVACWTAIMKTDSWSADCVFSCSSWRFHCPWHVEHGLHSHWK